MYKVIVVGEAKTDYPDLKALHGMDCQERFTEYIDDDFGAVSGGYMDFRFEDGKLMTYTEYDSTRELTKEELHDLLDYTTGQWSDGIGEGYEQFPQYVDGEEVYISPWYYGQKAKIYQEKLAEVK